MVIAPRNQTCRRECDGLVSPGAGILTISASFIIFSTAFPPNYWISALFYPIVRADRGPSCSLLKRPTYDLQFCILCWNAPDGIDVHTCIYAESHYNVLNSSMPTSTDVDACHKPHVDSVTKEVWKAIGALWRSTRLLTIQSKLMFYFSLIQSKLLYGSNAYFPSITVGVLDRLIRLSKSAIRDFYGLSRWTPTSPTFLALGVRPLASCHDQQNRPVCAQMSNRQVQ